MTIAHVVSTIKGSPDGDNITTDAADTTGADLIVVTASYYRNTVTAAGLTDSKGNTWTRLTQRDATNQSTVLFYCAAPTVGSGHTFSTTKGAGGSGLYYPVVIAQAFSGSHASPFGAESAGGTTGGATSVQPGSVTPSENDCLVVTGCDFGSGTGPSIDGGFTATAAGYGTYAGGVGGGQAYLIQTTAAAANPTWSWSVSSDAAAASAWFKAAGGGGGDTTAPVLTSPVGTTTGTTTATTGATTDEGNGTLYSVVTVSGTAPTATQVKAGQDNSGAAAAFAGSTAVGSTGAKTVSATALTAATAYYAHLMHEDAATNQSNVVSSSQFTTNSLPVTIAVTDADVFFSPYNWYSDGAGAMGANNVKGSSAYALTNNPGAYIKTKFTGTSCKLNVDVTALSGAGVSASDYPRIVYSVDGGAWTQATLASGDTQKTLATGLAGGTHSLTVVFYRCGIVDDRWTTPEMQLKVTGLELDAGADVAAPTLQAGRLLLYGDSNCEGHEAATDGTQDASLTHGFLTALGLECEVGIVAFASQGYVTAVGGVNLPDLEDSWDEYYSGASRLATGALTPAPDYILCYQGQNDGSDVTTACGNLIAAWRAAAPSAPIIIGSPTNQNRAADLAAAVTAAADANCFWVPIGENLLAAGASGANAWSLNNHITGLRGHPRYAAMNLAGILDAVGGGGGGSGVSGARIFGGF